MPPTIYRWSETYAMNPLWRPWYNPRKRSSLKASSDDCEMLRRALLSDPRMVHKEINASHVLQILRHI
jgi:hypothetical protein